MPFELQVCGVSSHGWEGTSESEEGSPECKIYLGSGQQPKEETGKKAKEKKKKKMNCPFPNWD